MKDKKDTEKIIEYLKSIVKSIDEVTTGNLEHKKGNLKHIMYYTGELIKELPFEKKIIDWSTYYINSSLTYIDIMTSGNISNNLMFVKNNIITLKEKIEEYCYSD